MKTLELDLKKKILIIEGNHDDIDISENVILAMENLPKKVKLKFICKGSELTEEIAKSFCNTGFNIDTKKICFNDYRKNHNYTNTAKESFISAIEAKGFYWLENPIKHPNDFEIVPDSLSWFLDQELKWQQAEAKTFINPLIFEI